MKTESEIKDKVFSAFFDWYSEGFRPFDCCSAFIELCDGGADIKYRNKWYFCKLTKTGRVKKNSFNVARW